MRHERLRRGWNQTVLAFHAGMAVADISRIETGRIRPYPAQVEKLSRVLGLDSAALLESVEVADAGCRDVERFARERERDPSKG